MKTRIAVVQKIDSRIAGADRYSGDVADFANGRNGLAAALRCANNTLDSNIRSFGDIGAGRVYLEYRTGNNKSRPCGFLDLAPGMTAADVADGNARIAADLAQDDRDQKIGFADGYAGKKCPDGASYYYGIGHQQGVSQKYAEKYEAGVRRGRAAFAAGEPCPNMFDDRAAEEGWSDAAREAAETSKYY